MASEVVTATYPGCSRIVGGQISFPVGSRPGRITFTAIGLNQSPQGRGDFVLAGSQSSTLTFPDCTVVSTDQSTYGDRPATTVTLEDRRAQWEFGRIDGVYNKRLGRNTPANPKTPRELATLLLTAMGESSFNVTAMPNTGGPEVYWYAANPATELERLCAEHGVLIGFDISGNVQLYPAYQGSGAPTLTNTISASTSADFRALPSEFQLVTGPVLWDCVLELTPVGRETNQQIKLIDDLSYTPAVGWSESWRSGFATLADDAYALAVENIFRMYRVTGVYDGGGANSLNPPGYPLDSEPDITSLDQLVIQPTTTALDLDDGAEGRRNAYVIGKHQTADLEPDITGLTFAAPVPVSVTIDPKTRIVRLSEAITQRNTTGGSGPFDQAPVLRLVASVQVIGANGLPITYTRTRTNTDPNAGSLPQVNRREQLQVIHPISIVGTTSGLTVSAAADNLSDVQAEADDALDAIEAAYTTQSAGNVLAYGLQAVAHAGDRHEIAWSWGTAAPSTRIGLNNRVTGGPNLATMNNRALQKSDASRSSQQTLEAFISLIGSGTALA